MNMLVYAVIADVATEDWYTPRSICVAVPESCDNPEQAAIEIAKRHFCANERLVSATYLPWCSKGRYKPGFYITE